jgi:predicted DNA-binding transcriptional regulator AlpA
VPDLGDLPDERLLRRREAAELIGTSERTLKRWDKSQKGPTPIRLSKRMLRYSVGDVREWLRIIGKRAVNDEAMF